MFSHKVNLSSHSTTLLCKFMPQFLFTPPYERYLLWVNISMLKDHRVLWYMFDQRYRDVIPDREVWPNQLRKWLTWFTYGAGYPHGAEAKICKFSSKTQWCTPLRQDAAAFQIEILAVQSIDTSLNLILHVSTTCFNYKVSILFESRIAYHYRLILLQSIDTFLNPILHITIGADSERYYGGEGDLSALGTLY